METPSENPAAPQHGADIDLLPGRYEIHCLRRYLASAIRQQLKDRRGCLSRSLAIWLERWGPALGLGACRYDEDKSVYGGSLTVEESRRVALAALPRLQQGAAPQPSALERRMSWIAATLNLGDTDAAILKVAVRAAVFAPIHGLAAALGNEDAVEEDEIGFEAIALLLGQQKRLTRDRLRSYSPLLQLGLVESRGRGEVAPSETVLRLARVKRSDPANLRSELFGRSPAATMAWSDFEHLGELRDLAAGLVAAALRRREQGLGILLYGAPGTGKTEFAKTLAKRLDAKAVFIGEADRTDGEPNRAERISHFALTSVLAAEARGTILVVDEADDIFTGVDDGDGASRKGSKVFMNRLVERCAAPTLWITNSPDRLGPAVMRRMALALHFREPPRAVRRRMVQRLARTRKLDLGATDLDRLSAMEAAPALFDAGLRTASLTAGGADAALVSTTSLLQAIGNRPQPSAPPSPISFDPALSAADCDLSALAARAQASFAAGETALSFCFHGLPGTGKSAYARHLAGVLGLDVLEKRASDILSMWVGSTEQNIAAAFADAVHRRAMLVIDEADSLLHDRAGALRSWEVSQVNEMLTWMERHPMPFVCTTNAMGSLDRATSRRFLFKVEFLPMTAAQAREAFRRAFGIEAPKQLDRLDPLTPGDFAVVARKANVLGERDPGALVAMLAAEVAAKPEGGRKRMGF